MDSPRAGAVRSSGARRPALGPGRAPSRAAPRGADDGGWLGLRGAVPGREEIRMARRLAILGGGNIGAAIARGAVARGGYAPAEIAITRRHAGGLSDLLRDGFAASADNATAVQGARLVLLCVRPEQADETLASVKGALDPARQILVSVVTGVSIARLRRPVGGSLPIVRAMPNTAILLGESMTCLATDDAPPAALAEVIGLFDSLGRTLVIDEELMSPATAVCACGIAFFLRAIRAASQGGIEVGFHAADAIAMAAQTARGAASLLLLAGRHPEGEIDRVTTPMGCTIAGLNQMEHGGFSSALIRGIVTSAEKARTLGDGS